MQEHGQADKAAHAEDAAGDDSQHLLGAGGEAEGVVNLLWRQQADEMPQEQEQDADMEQHAAHDELPAPQQLARAAPPGVLLAIETDQAARQKHGGREIGVIAEDKDMEPVSHGHAPSCP